MFGTRLKKTRAATRRKGAEIVHSVASVRSMAEMEQAKKSVEKVCSLEHEGKTWYLAAL